MRRTRIFVSSRFVEFRDIRSHMLEIAGEGDIELIDLDDGRPDDRGAIERSLKMLESADIFVLLLGHSYSDFLEGRPEKSITELEFEHAVRRRDAGLNVRIRAWQRNDEANFSDDASAFLERVKAQVVVGKLPSDSAAAAEAIIDDARSETDLLVDEGLAENAASLISRELDRLGLSISDYPAGADDPKSLLAQRRSLGMQALRIGDMKEAIRFFTEARETIGFDVVTNLTLALLLQRTMLPSSLKLARQLSERLESEEAILVDERTAEQRQRLKVLAAVLRANLDRTLGIAVDSSSAAQTRDLLSSLVPADGTSRPLLVELAAYEALSGDEDRAVESFRHLWHMYPDAALALIASPALMSMRKKVEEKMCSELIERIESAGIKIGEVRNLRRLRREVIAAARAARSELSEVIDHARPALISLNALAETRGTQGRPEQLGRHLTSSLANSEAELAAVESEIDEVVDAANALGLDGDRSEPNDVLAGIVAEEWLDETIATGSSCQLPVDMIMSEEVVEYGIRSVDGMMSVSRSRSEIDAELGRLHQQTKTAIEDLGLVVADRTEASLLAAVGERKRKLDEFVAALKVVAADDDVVADAPGGVRAALENGSRPLGASIGVFGVAICGSVGMALERRLARPRNDSGFFGAVFNFLVLSGRVVTVLVTAGVVLFLLRHASIRWRVSSAMGRALLALDELGPPGRRIGSDRPTSVKGLKWTEVIERARVQEVRLGEVVRLHALEEETTRKISGPSDQMQRWKNDKDHVRRSLLASKAAGLVRRRIELTESYSATEAQLRMFSEIDLGSLQRVASHMRRLNLAFATAPAIAFPDYVPRERSNVGDLTRIVVEGPDRERSSRRMAVVLSGSGSGSVVSESAVAIPRPDRTTTTVFDAYLAEPREPGGT